MPRVLRGLQISGINVVIYFAPTILADAGFTRGPAIFLSAGECSVGTLGTVLEYSRAHSSTGWATLERLQ